MKTSYLLFGFTVGLTGIILLPFIAVSLNNYLQLPIYDHAVMKGFGLIGILTGIGLFVYCSIIFKVIGKGTPVPIEPPKELVVSDIYLYVRNPIYLGYWLIVLGEFLLFGHVLLLVYLLLFMIGNHLYVVLFEERELKRRFNGSYMDYIYKTPRYFPRLF